jgi:CHAT domain-containing protein/Tfp pilus assembly protein PilF
MKLRSHLLPLFLALTTVAVSASAEGIDGALRGESFQNPVQALPDQLEITPLELNKPIERQITGTQIHSYNLLLAAGQYARVTVDQRGIDVVVRLFEPTGRLLAEVDSPNGSYGAEPVSIVTPTPRLFRFQIRPFDDKTNPGSYEINVEVLRDATQEDTFRVNAEMKARSLFAEADTLKRVGDASSLSAAAGKYKEALALWRSVNDSQGEDHALSYLGRIYLDVPNNEAAIDSYKQLLRLRRAVNNREGEAKVLEIIGTIYTDLNDNKTALIYYQQLLSLRREIGPPKDVAGVLNTIGHFYENWGDGTSALKYHYQALSLFQTAQDLSGEAHTFRLIGAAFYTLGDKKEALAYDTKALNIAISLRDTALEAITLNDIGNVHTSFGDKQKAAEAYNKALSIHRSSGNLGGESVTLGNIGWLYESQNEYYKALHYLDKALTLKRKLNNFRGEAYTLRLIGNVYHALGDYRKASTYYTPALLIMQRTGDRAGEALTLCSLASVSRHTDGLAGQLEYYQRSLRIYQETHDRWGETDVLRNIGSTLLEMGAHQEALKFFHEALALQHGLRFRTGEASTLTWIGITYSRIGDDKRALTFLEQAFSLYRAIDYTGCEACTLSSIASIYERQGKISGSNKIKAKALDYYYMAIAANEHIRSIAKLEEFKTKLDEGSADIYRRAIALNVELGRHVEAFNLSERARARTFLDQIGNSQLNIRGQSNDTLLKREQDLRSQFIALERELVGEQVKAQDQLNDGKVQSIKKAIFNVQQQHESVLTDLKIKNPAYASLRSVDSLTLPVVQSLLKKDTTLLSYVVLEDSTLVFIITRKTFKMVELPVSERSLRDQITWFLKFTNLRTQPATMKQLYMSLVQPVKEYLRTPLVGIIPNASLHYLPFAALTNGTECFGDERSLFYLPSASVLRFTPHKKQASEIDILALAQSATPGLPDLLYADQEVTRIAKLFHIEALVTPTATKATFLTRAGKHNIIHIAAHGQLNNVHPLFSRIRLAPSDENDDGSVAVTDIYGLSLQQTNVVVLSACETQVGPQSKGDDIIGLNRAFIYAGTSSVIASLWSVDDEATSLLMETFYKQLRHGSGKAQALQEAQRATQAIYPHPYYWAAFVLNGDPR